MKRFFASLAILLTTMIANSQIKVVQQASGRAANSTLSATFPEAPVASDVLVAFIGYYTGDSVPAPNGWTLIKQQSGSGTTGMISFYHVIKSGESSAFALAKVSNYATALVYEIAGVDVYNPINAVSSSAQTTLLPMVSSPAAVPTVVGTLGLASIASEGSSVTGVSDSGWTYTPSVPAAHPDAAAYSGTLVDLSPVSASFTLSNSDLYGLASETVLLSPTGTTGHTPQANAGGPYSGVDAIPVSFDGTASTDPRTAPLSYSWDFGDGSTGLGIQPTHVYAKTGSYAVTLTITNNDGYTATASTTATIMPNCSAASLGAFGSLNGFVPSPADAWHTDISGAAVDPMSDTILVRNAVDLAGSSLHPDFGSNGQYGIPYTVVDGIAGVPIQVTEYPDESDLTLYPIPSDMPIESAPAECSGNGDNHAIVFDRNSCVAYEMYHTQSCSTSTPRWSAGSTALWDFTQTQKRPYGMTSVDAAGLSVFEGLIRYDEVQSGSINHAIRFTAKFTKGNGNGGYFVAPATHAAGTLWGTDNVIGMRIRLKASYDTTNLGPQAKIIAVAMKKYGMILADNGSNMYFQGTSDPRWDDDDLNGLKYIQASAFELVSAPLSATYQNGVAPMFPNGPVEDAANHPSGNAPVISSFTASSRSIAAGQSVDLTPVISGSSYAYIDNVGFIRGPVTVSPTVTTTYTLTSRNAYGSTSASVTVDVVAGTAPILHFNTVQDQTLGAAPFTVSATSTSTGAITYSVISGPAAVSGNVVTLLGVGSVTLQATQAAAGSYLSATAMTTFQVAANSTTLEFNQIPDQTFGAAPFTVLASSLSTGTVTYAVISGPATLNGDVVTLTGLGLVTLKASQAAAGNYAATSATVAFQVNPSAPTLQFNAVPDKTYGAAPFTVTASSPSTGAVSYAVVNGPAVLAANVVTVTGTGTVNLAASQAAAGNYAASTATTSFQVKAAIPNLQFAPIANQPVGAAALTVSASSLSSGAVSYVVMSGPATISGNLVTVTGAGTVSLQASQAAAGNYATATATTSFLATQVTPSISINNIGTKVYGDPAFGVSAASASPGALIWTVSGPANLSGNLVTVEGAGIVTVSVAQAASGNYATATASTTFIVQDFQLAAPQMVTVQAGTPSTTILAISGQEGFTGSVNVTCALPATMIAATCNATSAQLSASANQGSSVVTIATVRPFNQASDDARPTLGSRTIVLALLLPFGLLLRKRKLASLALLLFALGLIGVTGCGAGIQPSTLAGTYDVTVTAVSGNTSHSTTVPVIVQ